MRFFSAFALCCLSTACGGVPSLASSTFENDGDGWSITGNGDDTTPTLMQTGGNPDGHICGKDAKDGDTWYFVAPPKYLGNVTSAYGKRLTWDLKQDKTFNQIRGRDVVLNGGGLAAVFNLRSSPGTSWTPNSATLDDTSGWLIENGSGPGTVATAEDLKLVLSNLTSLRIRGEFYDGPNDVTCLDNVYFGAPPRP